MGKRKISPDYTPVLASDGKPYAWTHLGFAMGLSYEQLLLFAPTTMKFSDYEKFVNVQTKYKSEYDEVVQEHQGHIVHSSGNQAHKVELPNTMRTLYDCIMEGSQKDAAKNIDAMLKIYSGLKKEYADPKYKAMARTLDDIIEVFDYKKGNLIKAIADEPFITHFMGVQGGAPKTDYNQGKENWDNVIDGLGDVYDLLMDYQHDCLSEVKLQYERQEMERTGMNGLKEQIYKDKLYAQHKKVIDDFEKLLAIEDNGQYDAYLNNELYHDLRHKQISSRDMNFDIGVLRGECRAIENGWGYAELKGLGFIAGQLEVLNAFKRDASEEDYNKIRPDVESAIRDLEQLKASAWDKKYPTSQEKFDLMNGLLNIIDKYPSKEMQTLFEHVIGCKEMVTTLKDSYSKQKDYEDVRNSDFMNPGPYLDAVLQNNGMRRLAEEMVILTRRKADIDEKDLKKQATEGEKSWAEKFILAQDAFHDKLTAAQRVEYFKTLNEYQTDLMIEVCAEAERIEQQILDGKIDGLGDLKDDPVVRGAVAERIALRTTAAGSKLEAVSDIVSGFSMQYEGEPLTADEVAAVNDPAIHSMNDLFRDKEKEKYIYTKAGDEEFRLRQMMSRFFNTNRKGEVVKGFGLNVDDDGRCYIKDQAKYESVLAERSADNGSVVKTYNEDFSAMVSQACKKLTELSNMKVKPDKDSEEFTNMRMALTKVSELNADNTPAQIQQAMFELKLYADEYTKNRTSSARNRREKAAELSEFANSNLAKFNESFGRNIVIGRTLAQQLSDSYEFKNAHLGEEDLVNNKQKAGELKGYMTGFNEYFKNLYNRFNEMKVNEASDSKQFTAMRKALKDLGDITAANTVKEVSDALSNLRKTSAAYISKIEVERGGKSINGGRRLSFAKELFNFSVEKTGEFNQHFDGKLNVNKSITEQAPGADNLMIIDRNSVVRQPSNIKELQEEEGIKENNKVVAKNANNNNKNPEKGRNKE